MLLCCIYKTHVSAVLSSRPMMMFGEISYSAYIWSFSVLTLLSPNGPAGFSSYPNAMFKTAAALSITTLVAYGSYLLIESPSRNWLRQILTPRQPYSPPASA
jgi:peptidoglycan/LPS O-acetylase OafA/YrhL